MNCHPIRVRHKIKAVIFDWAGTTVDYGCFAPLRVFLEVFAEKGVSLTLAEARGPMGMLKADHIRALTSLPRVAEAWREKWGRIPEEADVLALYERFEPALMAILEGYAEPIPGVLEVVSALRRRGLKIGSTTGYTGAMMAVVAPRARANGYAPDCCVTPDGLPAGRPAPWMCFENARRLGVYPMSAVVKVGDTLSDVKEGVNAGCVSVGVLVGSSEMGLTQKEAAAMPVSEFQALCDGVEKRYYDAGAHCVLRDIRRLPGLIDLLDERAAAP